MSHMAKGYRATGNLPLFGYAHHNRPKLPQPMKDSPVVAITGLGIVCGYGAGVDAFWAGLCSGQTSLRPVTRFKADAANCNLAAEVPAGIAAKDYVPKHYRKGVKVMARDTELAVIAAAEAAKDGKLTTRMHSGDSETPIPTTYPSNRCGCHIGAGLLPAEVPEITSAFATARSNEPGRSGYLSLKAWGTISGEDPAQPVGGMNNLPPLWMLKYLPNMLACHVTILHGLEGPSNTLTCSEASGMLCIGESGRVIERGAADLCFSGGAESKVNHLGTVRSQLLGRLANHSGGDTIALRPYATDSSGTVPGEGGAIIILERDDLAAKRGCTRYATVIGFGAAHSLPVSVPVLEESHPPLFGADRPRRNGLTLAIAAALKDAGLKPEDIDAVVPQALCVCKHDCGELAALREVFGYRLSSMPLIALSPLLGDCAAGSGSLQVAAGALCLHHQRIPARVHGGGAPAVIDVGPAPSRPATLRHVLVCTGSLAGQNAAIVLARA
jgi:3-oxoacyl-[acyl-carrier-protein] synthase II